MSAPLTAAQAIELLRKHAAAYNTREKLGALVEQVNADSPGRVTVLYSGRLGGGLSTEDVAKELKASVQDVRIINNSQAAELLTSREFQDAASGLDGVLPSEFKDAGYSSPTTKWLYHPTDGPWAQASARFADGARGDVRVVVPNAAPGRVFGATELPRILANEQVTSVEGLPRPMLAQLHAREGQQAVFEMVAAQSHANLGNLRAGVNYSGALLRDEQDRLHLDSRTYFRDGPVQGHVPPVASTSRELGELAGPPTVHAQAGQARLQAWQLEVMPDAGLHSTPATTRLARSLGHGAGVVTTGIEAADTAHDYARLRGQGNLTGAQAVVGRSASRGAGAWLGFEAGLAVGSPLGPGAVAIGAVGAVVGGVAGDKLADVVDHHRIYTQRGSDGNTWQADPTKPAEGWTRTLPPLPAAPQGQRLSASPELADELNFKAVTKATELALSMASARAPFQLPASGEDAASAYGGDWSRNPASGSWQRQINHDRPGMGFTQTASPERAVRLDAQADQVIADNAARSPAAIAATFKAVYVQNDWQRHSQGKLPDAIEDTLAHPERVAGSDGRHYARDAGGQWTHDGLLWDSHADGNLRVELDRTLEAQRRQVQALLPPGLAENPGLPITTLEAVRVTPSVEQQAEIPAAVVSPPPRSPEPQAAPLPQRLSDARHPGHGEFQHVLQELRYAEANRGIPHGRHSEQVAAALLVEGERQGTRIDTVRIAADGRIEGIHQRNAFAEPTLVRVDPTEALSVSMEAHAVQWAQARSPHLVSNAPVAERTPAQQQGLAALSPADQAMFARIRQDVPAHIGDDHVMRAVHDAKQADIPTRDQIDRVIMAGDRIWVAGTTEGFRSMTEVSQAAPPLQESAQQVQALNREREQQLAMDQQRHQNGPSGPSMG